ncbi:NADH-quinone oxidoreductase subunit NuoH [Archaeoglobus profundus]|uniref:Respiratory-chain NADH dehydrogenase subunit 1 n=1 Tax=Archaeoglobus profundus (strain DSM 5631 / JCM 9629 / NBRC 100127 / Av18) TaxID=572546 RepID=D2RES9_ARCPA|nr:NADH-quinone oxidoreductase subunit NuoH [Archaeoglobus profundus]ADB58623.1 respiratory-chain NADH dehydrogenase subunit 1 [Archaeoglobus profundus DSM 5631]
MLNVPIVQGLINRIAEIPLLGLIVEREVFAVLIAPGLLALLLYLGITIWFERKIAARIQWRVGPKEVSPHIGGLLQVLADALRYLYQEVIVHRDANKVYFLQLPILSFIPILLALTLVPAGNVYALRSEFGIPCLVALIALIPLFVIAIGWSANNRFAYIGLVRESFMYISYEIPLILSVVAMLMLYKTGDAITIVERQSIPGVFLNPLAFLTFLIATVMASGRLPFDIPEADQEIAFGPYVEYSGIMFGLVMVLAYEKLYLLSLLMVILFFGGWRGFEIAVLGDLSDVIWLMLKALIVMCAIVITRAIYARYRIDQALRIGWGFMMALAIASIAFSGVIAWLL